MALSLEEIAAAAAAGPFWIDMASSVRDPADDSFSLDACEAVLAACAPFVAAPVPRAAS